MDKILQKQDEIGQRVRFLRNAKGWTQDALAEKAGFSGKSAISEIENGSRNVELRTIVQLEQALHAKIITILPSR